MKKKIVRRKKEIPFTYKVRVFDVLFALVVIVLLFSIPYALLKSGKESGSEVKIFKENKLFASAPLDKNGIVEVGGMKIEIKEGRARVLSSDCPKEICKSFGWISSQGQSIVCVANKVIIEASGGKEDENNYVAMSY
ncbi:MAG: NusG domain II-containing protein [Candidatus Firestonebacteria bacterium]